jgi:hypothetical protein
VSARDEERKEVAIDLNEYDSGGMAFEIGLRVVVRLVPSWS